MPDIKETASQPTDRLFRVMEFLAENRLPMRLIDIAAGIGIPQSTALRYLRTLCAQGYAYHDDTTGLYALTWKICRLSESVKVNLVLRSMASPFLQQMANELSAGSCLVVRQGYVTQYLDFVDNPVDNMNTMLRIGKNAPIHTTGSGKVLLSALTDRKITEIVEAVGLAKLTKKTITDENALLQEIECTRKRGYGIDDEECEEGHKCVSVPIYDYDGCIAAAISVFDTAEKLTETRIERDILPVMLGAAREISYRLGYSGE